MVSESGVVQVYDNTSLKWAAQLASQAHSLAKVECPFVIFNIPCYKCNFLISPSVRRGGRLDGQSVGRSVGWSVQIS